MALECFKCQISVEKSSAHKFKVLFRDMFLSVGLCIQRRTIFLDEGFLSDRVLFLCLMVFYNEHSLARI